MLLYDTKIWTTKDGRQIAISEMEDRHLNNTIAFLERNAKALQFQDCLNAYLMMPDDPSDGVFFALVGEPDRIMAEKPLNWLNSMPTYRALVEERQARDKVGF